MTRIPVLSVRPDWSNEEGARFECSLDDGPFALCTEEMTIPALSVGDHTLKVRALDLAGNVDETPLEHAFNVRYPAEKLRTNVGGGIGCARRAVG